nr:hypothetical protein [Tanacetum cinerariifolium]
MISGRGSVRVSVIGKQLVVSGVNLADPFARGVGTQPGRLKAWPGRTVEVVQLNVDVERQMAGGCAAEDRHRHTAARAFRHMNENALEMVE